MCCFPSVAYKKSDTIYYLTGRLKLKCEMKGLFLMHLVRCIIIYHLFRFFSKSFNIILLNLLFHHILTLHIFI